MTRYEVELNMDIISAFAEGKDIQYKDVTGSWRTLEKDEELNMEILKKEPNNYRIKPEPKYRPFKDAKECWQEMLKHQPFGWIKNKKTGALLAITAVNTQGAFTSIPNEFDEAFRKFVFADGTVFGVKEE